MTDKPTLGTLSPVEVRDHWANEATDFTPWLAEEANIARLGEALGLNLTVVDVEANVGPFRADILCQEIGSENLVLIENQLEPTDHTHLGQIITYSAGLDPVRKVIWIAKQFREPHRAAIDWLNRISADDFSFFGVEIELWKIGDSAAAPRFDVIAAPNNWARQASAAARESRGGTRSARGEAFREFWGGLAEYTQRIDWPLDDVRVSGLTWARIPVDVIGLRVNAGYSPTSGRASLLVLFRSSDGEYGDEAIRRYDFIAERRSEVEAKIGDPIRWIETVEAGGGYAQLTFTPGPQVEDPDLARFEWLTQTSLTIRSAFEEAYEDFDPEV
jgi:hypothetical protein